MFTDNPDFDLSRRTCPIGAAYMLARAGKPDAPLGPPDRELPNGCIGPECVFFTWFKSGGFEKHLGFCGIVRLLERELPDRI